MGYSEDIRKKHSEEREKHNQLILSSGASKRIVAAGPGTGKTHLFNKICELTEGEVLILTFINELVTDLRGDLGDVADVRTLHSFARLYLKAPFFMPLTDLISEDYSLISGVDIDFKEIFSTLSKKHDDELDFYSHRRQYYSYFGPYCSVYTLIKIFEQTPERIPLYKHILVDEYQDFNNLETMLLDLLAKKSPILLAGDDDQSLYSFKYADPNEIRSRFNDKIHASFTLPYCSRCPEVLVTALNEVVAKAQEKGFLGDRISKDYKYFSSEEKDRISDEYSKIHVYLNVFETMQAYKIDQYIRSIPQKNKSILIICPLKKQIPRLAEALSKKGYSNIVTPNITPGLRKEDGYKLLLSDEISNLGWRILAGLELDENSLRDVLINTINIGGLFHEYLPEDYYKEKMKVINALKKLDRGATLNAKETEIIFQDLGYDPNELALNRAKEEILDEPRKQNSEVKIRIVTSLGAKGLTEDHVILANFNDRYLIGSDGINDEKICKFLVSLTRAKKSLAIFSSDKKLPVFLTWIKEELLDI